MTAPSTVTVVSLHSGKSIAVKMGKIIILNKYKIQT